MRRGGGLEATARRQNPEWHDAHHVFVKYCDGGSFAGDTEIAVPVDATVDAALAEDIERLGPLQFRGRPILNAVVRELERLGLGGGADPAAPAHEVLLSGTSAGGLAVLINADYVRALLPAGVDKFKARIA